jgi:ankyrin repeat protein
MLKHRELQALIKARGSELETNGVCFGFIGTWVMAACLGGACENEFFRRLSLLCHSDDVADVLTMIEKAKQSQIKRNINPIERRWLAVNAWLDALSLLQNLITSGSYLEFVGRTRTEYVSTKGLLNYVYSKEIEKRGGLFCHFNRCCVLNDLELATLLGTLEKVCGTTRHALFIHAPRHTFGLKYLEAQNRWQCVDINLIGEKTEKIACKVLSRSALLSHFKSAIFQAGHYCSFNVKLYTSALTELTVSPVLTFFKPFECDQREFDRRDGNGCGLLMLKVNEKEEASAISLLKRGYRISKEIGALTDNAFYRAVINNLNELVSCYASLNLTPCFSENCTLLAIVISRNRKALALCLLESTNLSLESYENRQGLTPLHYALLLGYEDLASALILKGASLTHAATNGDRALHFACSKEFSPHFYQLMLRQEPNLAAVNKNAETAIDLACRYNNTVALDALLEKVLSQRRQLQRLYAIKNKPLVESRVLALTKKNVLNPNAGAIQLKGSLDQDSITINPSLFFSVGGALYDVARSLMGYEHSHTSDCLPKNK